MTHFSAAKAVAAVLESVAPSNIVYPWQVASVQDLPRLVAQGVLSEGYGHILEVYYESEVEHKTTIVSAMIVKGLEPFLISREDNSYLTIHDLVIARDAHNRIGVISFGQASYFDPNTLVVWN